MPKSSNFPFVWNFFIRISSSLQFPISDGAGYRVVQYSVSHCLYTHQTVVVVATSCTVHYNPNTKFHAASTKFTTE